MRLDSFSRGRAGPRRLYRSRATRVKRQPPWKRKAERKKRNRSSLPPKRRSRIARSPKAIATGTIRIAARFIRIEPAPSSLEIHNSPGRAVRNFRAVATSLEDARRPHRFSVHTPRAGPDAASLLDNRAAHPLDKSMSTRRFQPNESAQTSRGPERV